MDIRNLTVSEAAAILDLYAAASIGGTLGRDADEYELGAMSDTIGNAVRHGFCLGAFEGDLLCGEIHASRLRPRRFAHVFAGLTVAVRPEHQGRGIGRALFVELLARIDALEPRVLRIELMLQAGNPGALELYRTVGFVEEGRLRGRVRKAGGIAVDEVAGLTAADPPDSRTSSRPSRLADVAAPPMISTRACLDKIRGRRRRSAYPYRRAHGRSGHADEFGAHKPARSRRARRRSGNG